MENNFSILLTGGGTMGHISPNLAILPDLLCTFNEVHYIGAINGLEKDKINNFNKNNKQKLKKEVIYHSITTTKLDRVHLLKNIVMPFKLIKGIFEARKIIKQINPSVLFSKGGFVSVPVVIASKMLKVPIVIHESDLSMGLANKIASKRATTVCTTFPETAKKCINGVYTGSPLNPKIFLGDGEKLKKQLKLHPSLPTILITGGSLGSSEINKQIEKILPELTKKYNVIHLTGKNKRVKFKHLNYYQFEFTDDIGSYMKASDLIISRAGSNTIFEIASLKKPMLLIPLPKSASRGDQIENAEYFKKLKIAEVINQEDLEDGLLNKIDECFKNIQIMKNELNKTTILNGKENILNEIYKASNKTPELKSVKDKIKV